MEPSRALFKSYAPADTGFQILIIASIDDVANSEVLVFRSTTIVVDLWPGPVLTFFRPGAK